MPNIIHSVEGEEHKIETARGESAHIPKIADGEACAGKAPLARRDHFGRIIDPGVTLAKWQEKSCRSSAATANIEHTLENKVPELNENKRFGILQACLCVLSNHIGRLERQLVDAIGRL